MQRELVTWDTEKAELLNNIFVSVFTNKCFSHTTWDTEDKVRDWENELLVVGEDQIWDHLRNLEVQKSMGLMKCTHQILRELADEGANTPLFGVGGNTLSKDNGDTEVLNVFFASVYNSMTSCSLGIQPLWAGRSQLESSVQFWASHYKKDTDVLEHIQRKATNLVKGLEQKSFEEQEREKEA